MSKGLHGFGINVDLNHFDKKSFDQVLDILTKLQVKWLRLEIDYFKYSDSANFKYLVSFCKKVHAEGFIIVGLLSQFIPLTALNLFYPSLQNKPVLKYLKEYLLFINILVPSLKKYISAWEIWNEQNSKRFWVQSPSPHEYVQFFKMVRNVIKKHDSNTQIIFGGLYGNDITPIYPVPQSIVYMGFIEKSLQLGVGRDVDYFAFHPYTRDCYISYKNRTEILDGIKKKINELKDRYPQLPLIISEIGVSRLLNPRLSYKDISFIYKSLLDYCNSLKIPMCIYALADSHPKYYFILNPDRDFGFLDHSLKKKDLLHHFLKK